VKIVTPCGVAVGYLAAVIFTVKPEDGGSKVLRSVGILSQTRGKSDITSLTKKEIGGGAIEGGVEMNVKLSLCSI
jgi:hypothetical protein